MPIYWAFLTFMLLTPGTENKEYSFMFSGIDKILHFLIFTLLGFLFRGSFPKISFLYYICILSIYAVLTEIMQDAMQMGRSGEILDLVADFSGLLFGYYIYNKLLPLLLKVLDRVKL